jgi:hypothetical protein
MIIHDARFSDLTFVGRWLCQADKQELAVTRDVSNVERLALDAFRSPIKKIAWHGMFPVMAFGALKSPDEDDTAIVWGFKSEEGWRAIRAVTKYIQKTMIPELRAVGVRHAVCLVHPSNRLSHKWLLHLGFAPSAKLQGIGSRREDMLLFRRDEPDA